jgi:hypothetical protein
VFGLDELDRLAGRAFPGGSFLVTAAEDAAMRDVVGAPRAGAGNVDVDVAHPVWMFAGPQRAMGITIDDLFGWCGSSAADGPMLGETQLVMPGPLLTGRHYDVTGEIVAATRKQGRRAGVFDIVTFELNVTDGDVSGWRCRTSFVFPRRS